LILADGVCGCVYNPHPIGVFYDTVRGQWAIFTEDSATMSLGLTFTIEDWSNGPQFFQQATSANTYSNYTLIDNPSANGNPTARLLVTRDWGVA